MLIFIICSQISHRVLVFYALWYLLIFFDDRLFFPIADLPAGQIAEFLVGFSNKGNDDFVLETLDASFRYPMDFSFYIQNFTTIAYNKRVKPHHEATLAYSFIPAEAFAGRPFGLSINLRYRDAVSLVHS